jgi:predicted Zn-dependent peptidase
LGGSLCTVTGGSVYTVTGGSLWAVLGGSVSPLFPHTTDELVKIGLDAGDNIIKVTPLDGGKDGYTITKTADKPGNVVFSVDLAATRKMLETQKQQEEILKKIEEERKGNVPFNNYDDLESRTVWGEAADKSIEYALLSKGSKDYKVESILTIRFGSEESLQGKFSTELLLGWQLQKNIENDSVMESLGADVLVISNKYDNDVSETDIHITATRQTISPVLSRIAKILRSPNFSSEIFDPFKERKYKSAINWSYPKLAYIDSIENYLRYIPKGYPNYDRRVYEKEFAQDIKNVYLWDIERFYKEFFGMTDASIVVVGDFELNGVKNIVLKEFSNWPSLKTYIPLAEPSCFCNFQLPEINLKAPNITKTLFWVCWPTFIYGYDPYQHYTKPDSKYNRSLNGMIDYVIEDRSKIIKSEFFDGCGPLYKIKDNCLQCDSIGIEKTIDIIKSEIINLKLKPITQIEIDKHKWDFIFYNSQDYHLCKVLEYSLQDGKTFKKMAEYKNKILNMSAEEVNNAINNIDVSKFVVIKVEKN